MSDYRYYASESTLKDVSKNLEELNSNLDTYFNYQFLLVTVIALILCFSMVEKFVDKCLNSRR